MICWQCVCSVCWPGQTVTINHQLLDIDTGSTPVNYQGRVKVQIQAEQEKQQINLTWFWPWQCLNTSTEVVFSSLLVSVSPLCWRLKTFVGHIYWPGGYLRGRPAERCTFQINYNELKSAGHRVSERHRANEDERWKSSRRRRAGATVISVLKPSVTVLYFKHSSRWFIWPTNVSLSGQFWVDLISPVSVKHGWLTFDLLRHEPVTPSVVPSRCELQYTDVDVVNVRGIKGDPSNCVTMATVSR